MAVTTVTNCDDAGSIFYFGMSNKYDKYLGPARRGLPAST